MASRSSSGEATDASVPQSSIRDVFSFATTRRIRLCIAGSFAAACVSGATLPAIAFYFARAFMDLARSTSSDIFMSSIRELAYVFLVMGAILMTSMTIQAGLQETAAMEMAKNMKKSWFQALLRQDMAYHDIHDVAGQATIISANGNKFKKGVGRKLSEAVQFTVTFFGALAYAFYATWKLSLAVLAASPILAYSVYAAINLISTESSRTTAVYAKAGAIVTRTVTNIRTILSLNAVERMVREYKEATQEAMAGAIANSWLVGLATGSIYATSNVAYIIVTLLGAWLLYSQVEENGCDPSGVVEDVPSCDPRGMDIMGALMGVSFAAGVFPQVSVAIESMTKARSACYPALVAMRRRLKTEREKLEAEDIEKQDKGDETKDNGSTLASSKHSVPLPEYAIDSSSEEGLKPTNVHGDIEFKNVTFAFPARRETNVLVDFSLRAEAGMTVALVGCSGSGKSTAVSLIERFYDPCSGTVTLDGVDLRQLNVRWLRQQIGLVLQEPKLFARSIKDNIMMGNPTATMEDIEEAARMANAHDFIMSFPKGFDTQVGDLGAQLSGGQRQRIAIARVLVKHPKILLLDEATSSLDSTSERLVQEALDNVLKMKSVTTFVIAHRLSTIRSADLIVVMDKGKIVETGTHDSLLALQGAYHSLVQAQKTRQNIEADAIAEKEKFLTQSSLVSVSPFDETIDSEVGRSIAVRLSNVSFRYPARPDTDVLRDFNLAVYEGETLALVGESGCGKSTIIQLLEGFYRPNEGVVEYCGEDLKNVSIGWLRDELGLVSQEATLFDGTIADNIRFGFPEATHAQVIEAAKQANCHEFISEFPDGYKTMVKDGGTLVSGGQKQRIAIARALIKKPKVLLLDEATSALDSHSEKIVQAALEQIMTRREQTVIVIAHRLATVRNADRIAVIDDGAVAELGTHDELMSKPNGKYRKLQAMQDLSAGAATSTVGVGIEKTASTTEPSKIEEKSAEKVAEAKDQLTKSEEAAISKRAWLMGVADWPYLAIGVAGALVAGLNFPAMGFVWAYMIELLYQPVVSCEAATQFLGFSDCDAYYESVVDDMRRMSYMLTYGFIGLVVASLAGLGVTYWGFGSAAERMSKRVRDAAFTSIVRQEIAWHDLHPPGELSSRLAEDAALLQAFAGEPIRSMVISLSSVLVGVIVAFVYMWPFALLILFVLPFLAVGAALEMKSYLVESDDVDENPDESSPGGIVIETLSNIRTVASLSLEQRQAMEYDRALEREEPHPLRTNFIKGAATGLGQLLQMWAMALMFWWGGWLMSEYGDSFTYRGYLIAMFALFMSVQGLALVAQGTVDKVKAKAAAARLFEIIDRQSEIDPLSTKGETLF